VTGNRLAIKFPLLTPYGNKMAISGEDFMKGFAHPAYADSLAEFGAPRELPLCGGWILERPIPASSYTDAMGCYPLFVCRDWKQLNSDLDGLESDLVSLSLVTDPFGRYDEELLRQSFDLVIPFKKHFVADLSQPANVIVSRHHRKYVRRAARDISIDICENPVQHLDEWTTLYGCLSTRFHVGGIRAFSRSVFEKQLNIPGAVMFRALHQGVAVTAHLVFAQNEVCYGHLVGGTPAGQELMASYALYWTEIEYFAEKKVRWIDWGAGAGLTDDGSNGLSHFKRGWSTGTKTSYFCGRILDRERYEEIVASAGMEPTDYFPAYRKGEFG